MCNSGLLVKMLHMKTGATLHCRVIVGGIGTSWVMAPARPAHVSVRENLTERSAVKRALSIFPPSDSTTFLQYFPHESGT